MKRRSLQSLMTKYSSADQELIRSAREFAEQAHRGQLRKSGQPFMIHPLTVAQYAAGLGMDAVTVSAALLHDVVEDTDTELTEIETRFGADVAALVDGVTKLGQVEFEYDGRTDPRYEASVENLRKLLLAMSRDLRVIIIKMLDRLHNLQTLEYLSPEKQNQIGQESLEIFAPLADRLGMGAIKAEIEDLGFKYAQPAAFSLTSRLVAANQPEQPERLEKLMKTLSSQLAASNIAVAAVDARHKHLYSVYKKLQKTDGDISKIYDLMALRIIVGRVADCYQALGILHKFYKPMIHRIKDYIAVPKPNGYRSLHTTVITPENSIVEIQIRTQEMHDEAEYGLAAHALYNLHKDTKAYKQGQAAPLASPSWLSELVMLSNPGQSFTDLIEDLKIDLFRDRIFVFSPEGDLFDLPEGATPLDFAFAVHSEVGLRTHGAKVNSRIAPLNKPLENRDIVEILTKKSAAPSQGWLAFVKTANARNKIRAHFRSQDRSSSIAQGREIINSRLKAIGINKLEEIDEPKLNLVIGDLNLKDSDGLLAGIGEGTVNPATVLRKLAPTPNKPSIKSGHDVVTGKALVSGAPEVPCYLAACCNPQPGDAILGYITRGSGITVHRLGCDNLPDEPDRLIACEWELLSDEARQFESSLMIVAISRIGLIRDLTSVIANSRVNIVKITSRELAIDNKYSQIIITINAHDVVLRSQLIQRLESVNGVRLVENYIEPAK